MKTSAAGIRFLAKEEALVLVAYDDGKHMSWGFGHNDPMLVPGARITVERALALLAEDLAERERAVERMLKAPPKQHELDALVSCYYNKGNRVGRVVSLINAGHKDEAMAALLTINRNEAGEFRLGLAERRLQEAKMFLKAIYPDAPTIKLYRGDPRTTAPEEIPFPGA